MGLAKRILALPQNHPLRKDFETFINGGETKEEKVNNQIVMKKEISVKKGDEILTTDERKGIIVKYPSNKEIHLNTGAIISKDMIKEVLSSNNAVAAVKAPTTPKPVIEKKLPIERSEIQGAIKFNFNEVEDGAKLEINEIAAFFESKSKKWVIEAEAGKVGSKRKVGTGPKNWKAFQTNVVEGLQKGSVKSFEEFEKLMENIEIFEH